MPLKRSATPGKTKAVRSPGEIVHCGYALSTHWQMTSASLKSRMSHVVFRYWPENEHVKEYRPSEAKGAVLDELPGALPIKRGRNKQTRDEKKQAHEKSLQIRWPSRKEQQRCWANGRSVHEVPITEWAISICVMHAHNENNCAPTQIVDKQNAFGAARPARFVRLHIPAPRPWLRCSDHTRPFCATFSIRNVCYRPFVPFILVSQSYLCQSLIQREVHGNIGDHVHRNTIQQRRSIAPLQHCFFRSLY
jgi:hypothetical protein